MKRQLIQAASAILLLSFWAQAQATCGQLEQLRTFRHVEIGDVKLLRDARSGTNAVLFSSQMAVNTDGAPDAYHPDDAGITHLCNGLSVATDGGCVWKAQCMADYRLARSRGFRGSPRLCFFAMATDSNGVPLIQGTEDPRPGYFVSLTALKQPGGAARQPQRQQDQLDSHEIPFVVIPRDWPGVFQGLELGDFAVVMRRSTGQMTFAIVGDAGPRNKLGEGSIAAHRALGNDPFQMRFGVRRARLGIGGRDVAYILFPRSLKRGQTITPQLINEEGARLLERFGGVERLRACLSQM
jgi:hypothetical protein